MALSALAVVAWVLALVYPGTEAFEPHGGEVAHVPGLGGSAHVDHQSARVSDGLPSRPTETPTAVAEAPLHPHPITPAHERIFRENNLVGALNLAVDLEDPVRIRALVAQYRAEFPEDEHVLQEGYAIIADCLDGPDEALRARAQRFWRTQIRSQTRRYVRRHCLEP